MQKRRAIALGFFDGVHLGHLKLMEQTIKIGKENGLVPSVTTFDVHPLNILHRKEVPLINSSEDRAWLIHNISGIEDALFLHFDKHTTQIAWDKFIDYLIAEFGAEYLIAGEDYTFGNGGIGNSQLLKQKCNELGLGCAIIPKVTVDGVTVSSTIIRDKLLTGNISQANVLLGHYHILTDTVRYGFHLGSKLGTPTINMQFQQGVLVPAYGVYVTKVYFNGAHTVGSTISPTTPCIGVTNIGARPTVDDSGKVTAETHILNYRGNLYGRKVRIEFHEYLRSEIKFSGLEELKAQIAKDCIAAKQFFSGTKLP